MNIDPQLCSQASTLWQGFDERFKSVTGESRVLEERRALHTKKVEGAAAPISRQEQDAGSKIAAWWRELRNSKKFSTFNPQGAHPDQFHTLLSDRSDVKRKFDHQGDRLLLRELEANPWQGELFRRADTHYNALSLFASGKITWQQKATLSLVIETSRVFGSYEAIALLNEDGTDFSEQAKPLIKNYIRYFPIHSNKPYIHPSNGFLTDDETRLLIALVRQLPKSEQFIFNFFEQVNSDAHPEGFPTQDSRQRYRYSRLLKRDQADYQGVLFFSHGIRNAIGLAHYGSEDWVPIIPRLGEQSIDDVELLMKKGARLTISGESCTLGLVPASVSVHGVMSLYPDQFAHDEYHSCIASILGSRVLKALDRSIEVTREHFGIRWSKDIWNLRDGDLSTLQTFDRRVDDTSPKYVTDLFATSLNHRYGQHLLESCSEELQQALVERPILLGRDRYPNQILLNLALDIVLNSDKWKSLSILDDETLYYGAMRRLLKMVKYLKSHGLFRDGEHNADTSKAHILVLEYFVRSFGKFYELREDDFELHVEWNDWREPATIPSHLFREMDTIAQDAEVYLLRVKNKELECAYVKSEEAVQKRNESLAYQLAQNPSLAENSDWVKNQYLYACKTANRENIEYFYSKQLTKNLSFETLHSGFLHVQSVDFFDWLVNFSQVLQLGEKKMLFPHDFEEVEEVSGIDPDNWTTKLIVQLKESKDQSAERELEMMREQYALYLRRRRSTLSN